MRVRHRWLTRSFAIECARALIGQLRRPPLEPTSGRGERALDSTNKCPKRIVTKRALANNAALSTGEHVHSSGGSVLVGVVV